MGVLTLVAIAGALLWLDPILFAAGLALLPLTVLLMVKVRPKIRSLSQEIRDERAGIASFLLQSLQALRFVKASNAEALEQRRFHDRNEELVGLALTYRVWSALATGANGVLTSANMAVVLILGAMFVRQGTMTPGDLVAFFLLQQRVYGPLNGFAGMYLNLQKARAAMVRLFEVLDAEPEVLPPEQPRSLPHPSGHLRLEGVRFSYGEGRDVLNGVDLDIPAGSSIALVGPSGVGKTTLIDLLLRLRDPDQGRVLLDGIDLRELEPGHLLDSLALVGQQAILFSGTIADNLAYNRPDVTRDQMDTALERVGLGEFMRELPDGLDTDVGERGARMSEGQRQRMSIARALLRRPRILLVDEGTSAQDWLNDQRIADVFSELAGEVTRVYVTHRLNLARAADRVAVLHRGEVVQTGTHADLLADPTGLYARLWQHQAGRGRPGPPPGRRPPRGPVA